MEKIQFRIATRGNQHWPQVRFKGLFWWKKWFKITKYPGYEFKLYSGGSRIDPKTFEESKKIIEAYKVWYKDQHEPVTYKDARTL